MATANDTILFGAPQWLSGGAELAGVAEDGTALEIVEFATRQSHRLTLPAEAKDTVDWSWSPDGRFLAYVEAVSRQAQTSRIWMMRLDDDQAFPVTEDGNSWGPIWSRDGASLYFISDRGGAMDLWAREVDSERGPVGSAIPVTVGIGMRSASFSSDGSKLAYSKGRSVMNVWRVPILRDRPATWADAEPVSSEQAYIEEMDVSPDGTELVLNSDRAGNLDLWVVPLDGGEWRALTTHPGRDWAPRYSADGKEVVFHSHRDGTRDLSDILSRGALSPERAVDLARDMANGLAKAHEKRIVHRDLKPANIMVTEEGVPKIIDFGLAKLLEPLEADSAVETAIRQQTEIGQLLGTVSYMSPEQARGQAVDARSDVFSFGVMLYEMVTGSVPFEAPSSAEVLNAIIHAPLPHGAREISPKLHRVIDKCTAKNPDDRYPTGVALLADLQKLSQPAPRVASTRSYIALTIGAAVLIASALSLISNRETDVGDGVPRLTNPIQLTRALGVENYPAWSPDGTTLAYVSRVEESQDIWMVAASGGEPVNLTPSFEGNEFAPSWSPDGLQIAFGSESEGGGCFVMSVDGDQPPLKVASLPTNFVLSRPQWSRDGKELACVVIDARGAAVEIVSLEAAISRRIPLAGRQNLRLDLAWSPDERFFAYVDAVNDLSEITQLWVTRVSDGESFAITEERTEAWSPSWSLKGGSLFFVSNRGGTFDLWQQHMAQDGSPVGEPQRVTAGLGMRQAVFSRDGRRLAYSRGARVANVWRVPILSDREATWADATQITFDQALVDTFDLSHDGERLVVASNRSGNADLWLVPAEGGEMLQLTTDPTPDWVPGWSPDGMSAVFYSYRRETGTCGSWISARVPFASSRRMPRPTWHQRGHRTGGT
jgi:Tol biopolymer transport system component